METPHTLNRTHTDTPDDKPRSHFSQVIIFAGGDAADGPMVRRALDAAPNAHIVAADGGAHLAHTFGYQVNTLIGDMDSISPAEFAELVAQGVDVQRYPEEKDLTDLEAALEWAAKQGADWIRIIGGLGGRIDHLLANVHLLALPALRGRDVRFVAANQQLWLVRPGKITLEGQPDDTISLIPVTTEAREIRTEGLYYPLRSETLPFAGARGISNIMQTARAHFEFSDGLLLVVHTIGRA